MKKIKSALISVFDKSKLKPILKILRKNNIRLISSGGTYKKIKKLKFECLEVSDFTGSKEILEGRVKTLHPKIHAGILYKRNNKKLNHLSRSSAAQSTLVIDDNSSCRFIETNKSWAVKKGLKIIKKDSIFEKNYWKIIASHDGYLKKYNSIHEREIEFFPEKLIFIGTDRIIKKKNKS